MKRRQSGRQRLVRKRHQGHGKMGEDMGTIRTVAVALLMVGSACRGPLDSGGCSFVRLEPLLRVTRVMDLSTGAGIPEVRVRDIVVDGHPVASFITDIVSGNPADQVTIDGSDLVCTVACAFGYQEGRWQLGFHAPGYRATTLHFTAQYAHRPECGVMTGQVSIEIELSPEASD
jgi:hypothetical protein